ncbi:MAG: RHS repeat-associated core domain-containing protein [Actinomycetota bacterium]|nr:RHS repeat-associated core domain-containing protein [Actinomycetota bacterium]
MRRLNVIAGLLAGLSFAALATAVSAQQQPIPPDHYTLDPRGVDLVTGSFNFGTTEVVIGQPGAGGLAYGRIWTNNGWRDSLIGGISFQPGEMIVSVGPISELFVPDTATGLTWVSKYDNGSTVIMDVGSTTITDRYGNVTIFDIPALSPDDNPYGATGGLPTSVTSTDGSVITYTYQERQKCFEYMGGRCVDWRPVFRISAVTTNRGYMIKYAYGSDDPQNAAYWRVANVRGINLAVDWCDASADSCTSFTETWPSVSYDSAEPPLTATDQSSRVTTYSYSNTQLATVRYPGATADDVAVAYNASPDFRVNAVTDASGAWTYGYSTSGTNQTTSVAGPLGQSLTAVVDMTTGRLTSATDALSNTWSYQYDSDLRVTRVTQPEGDYASYTYGARSNLTGTTWTSKGNTIAAITASTTYPADCTVSPITPATCNRPLSTTDALGAVTDYDWDETTGQLVSVTAPAPTSGAPRPQTRFTYDDFQARYHNGTSTFVNGSAIVLPIEVSACSTGTSCDGADNEILTTISYPGTGSANNLLPLSIGQGSGTIPTMAVTATTWTADGDVASADGPLSGTADTVTFIRDDARQLIGVIGPDPDGGGALLNRAQRLTYNSRGQVTLTEIGTASGGTWANFSPLLKSQTTYDAAQFFRPVEARQLSAGGAVSGVQSVTYDTAGRPSCTATRMNPASYSSLPTSACTAASTGGFGPDRIAQRTYDAVGRVLTSTSAYGTADSMTESVTYTANGLTASLTDGQGNVSIMEYDAFDRLIKLRYPNSTGGGTSTTDYATWTWNAAGQPTSSRDRAGGTTSYTWDLLGRLIDVGPPSGTPGSTAAFDNLGRQTSISTVPSSITVNTAYDALSRPVSQGTTGLGSMLFTHDPAGRLMRIEWPDGFQAEYAYDLTGAVAGIDQHVPPAAAVALAAYAYNNLGQLTGVTRNGGSGASSSFDYDDWARLELLSHDASGTGEDLSILYSYNPAGQIVERTVSNDDYVWTPATGGTSYTLNGLNQITTAGGASVTYDANQNVTGVLGNTYGYDAANNLNAATPSGGPAAAFVFDPLSRLASSAVSSTTTRYQYAGQQLVTEYDASGAVARRYVPGLGLDGVVTAYTGAGVTTRDWLLADERSSVVALTNSTGVVSSINRYDEYGVPASGNAGRFQYTGQAWLPEAGAYHYRARTYLPQTGRFLQTDPIGYGAGSNLYAYVGADPVNWADPSGLVPREYRCIVSIDRITETYGGITYNVYYEVGYGTCMVDLDEGAGGQPSAGGDGQGGGAAELDEVVVTASRANRLADVRLNFNLPAPREQLWVVTASGQIIFVPTRAEFIRDSCGNELGTNVPRPGFAMPSTILALIHTHPRWAAAWPAAGDYDSAQSWSVYGLHDGGAWVLRRGAARGSAPITLLGSAPSRPVGGGGGCRRR